MKLIAYGNKKIWQDKPFETGSTGAIKILTQSYSLLSDKEELLSFLTRERTKIA
jgi:hypothetical protein